MSNERETSNQPSEPIGIIPFPSFESDEEIKALHARYGTARILPLASVLHTPLYEQFCQEASAKHPRFPFYSNELQFDYVGQAYRDNYGMHDLLTGIRWGYEGYSILARTQIEADPRTHEVLRVLNGPELELPSEQLLSPENNLVDSMAHLSEIGIATRAYFGIDSGNGRINESSALGKNIDKDSVFAQKGLIDLISQGVLSYEEVEEWLPSYAAHFIADTYAVRAPRYSDKVYTLPFMRIAPSIVLDGSLTDYVEHGEYKYNMYMYTPGAAHHPRMERPGFEHGFDVLTYMKVRTALALELMKKAGWENPEQMAQLPLALLERGSLHPDSGAYWDFRMQRMGTHFKSFDTETIPGTMGRVAESLTLQAAAQARLHEALLSEGHPVCEPERVATHAIEIDRALPVHVVTDAVESRTKRHERMKGAVSVNTTGRYNEPANIASIISTRRSNARDRMPGYEKELTDILAQWHIIPASDWSTEKKLEALLAYGVVLAEPHINPPSDMTKEHALRIIDYLTRLNAIDQWNSIYAGFPGDYMRRYVRGLETIAGDTAIPVENTITLKRSVPAVSLGANGGGKSTYLATVLQHMFPSGLVVGSSSRVPENIRGVLATADPIEATGRSSRVFWGREQGKSSFVQELEGMEERYRVMLDSKELPYLTTGDEIGRRTDQLNAMALVGAEIIVNAVRGNYAHISTHCNSLNRTLGPVFDTLGVAVDWGTFKNFQRISVAESDFIVSDALGAAEAFIPSSLGTKWAEAEEKDPTTFEWGKEYTVREYADIHRERLMQLGWIRESYRRGEYQIEGAAGALLGTDVMSAYKHDLTSHELRSHKGVSNELIGTFLNPRWEQIGNVPDWVHGFEMLSDGPSVGHQTLIACFDLAHSLESAKQETGIHRLEAFRRCNIDLARLLAHKHHAESYVKKLKTQVPGFDFSAIDLMLEQLPEYDKSWAVDADEGEGETPVKLPDADSHSKVLSAATHATLYLETARVMAANKKGLHVCEVEEAGDGSIFEAQGLYGFGLSEVLSKDGKVPVVNDITIDKTTIFTGPQGSGKTEALLAIAETMMMGTLWKVATATRVKMARDVDVLPLITVPTFPERTYYDDTEEKRPSSLQHEARDRMGVIAQYMKDAPEGTRVVALTDEMLSSTNTEDASGGTRGLNALAAEGGHILIAATHSHETVWDMEKHKVPFSAKCVGAFTTEFAYQWLEGHGESMGLEVAEFYGLDPRVVGIAKILRDFIIEHKKTGEETPHDEIVTRYTQLLQPLIDNLRIK